MSFFPLAIMAIVFATFSNSHAADDPQVFLGKASKTEANVCLFENDEASKWSFVCVLVSYVSQINQSIVNIIYISTIFSNSIANPSPVVPQSLFVRVQQNQLDAPRWLKI
jgi:hypothetical protein